MKTIRWWNSAGIECGGNPWIVGPRGDVHKPENPVWDRESQQQGGGQKTEKIMSVEEFFKKPKDS